MQRGDREGNGNIKGNFLLRKIIRRNLNEAVSLAEMNVALKVRSISTSEIASFRFLQKIFLKRKVAIISEL